MQFIDLAKGLCIILVVIHHSRCHFDIPLLQNLRMPLYFALSGMFFKPYGNSLLQSALQKVNKLIVPLLFFTFVGDALIYTLMHLGVVRHFTTLPIVSIFIGREPINTPLWFLMCLFIDYVIFYFIDTRLRSHVARIPIVITCGAIGYLLFHHNIHLPFYLDSALSSMPYYYLGSLLRKFPLLTQKRSRWLDLGMGIVLIAAAKILAHSYGQRHGIDFHFNKMLGTPLHALSISILVVPGALLACKGIGRLPIVSYIGRYSIITLGTHYIIICLIANIEMKLRGTWGGWHVAGIAIALSLALTPLLVRYAPRLTAQTNIIDPASAIARLRSLRRFPLPRRS